MNAWFTIPISLIALVISIITAWLTFFRKGKLLMTQPTVIFFGPDGKSDNSLNNKIFLRTLLYSTSKRGQVIESMHVKIERGETKQNFSIWVYGDTNLYRGSGLFVSDSGVTYNHHFLLPPDGSDFKFLDGEYMLRVYANIVGNKIPFELYNINLSITKEQAIALKNSNAGLYFDWGPDRQKYYSHINNRPEKDFSELFFNEISKGKTNKQSKK